MAFFNKNLTIIYFEDRVCYFQRYDKDGPSSEMGSFDIPVHVIEDGMIGDENQLHYLLKGALSEEQLEKDPCLFVVSTTDGINRAMQVPDMTRKEMASLVENESENLFVQDLDAYQLDFVDLEGDQEMHPLLITILSKDLIEAYRHFAEDLDLKLEGILPLSTLLIQYAHRIGGGRIGLISTAHDGFYYANENRFYGRSEHNQGLIELMEEHQIEFSELETVFRGGYDARLIDMDREGFSRGLEAAVFSSVAHIEQMGNDFALEDNKLITGSLVEEGVYALIQPSDAFGTLKLETVFSVLNDHREDGKLFTKKSAAPSSKKQYILPVAALAVAFVILIGTFIYGEKLKQENRELIVQSTRAEEAHDDSAEGNAGAETTEGPAEDVDLAELITTVKSTAPDTLSVTGIKYQGGVLEVHGEGQDAAAIDAFKTDLAQALGKQVDENPSASIGDMIYFNFSIPLHSASSGTTSAAGVAPNASEGTGDGSLNTAEPEAAQPVISSESL